MAEPRDTKRSHIPDKEAILVGRIASEWALLELKMCYLLGELLDVEPSVASSVLLTVPSDKVRGNIIQNVAANTLSDDDLKKRVNRILKRIGRAAQKRNDLMHSLSIHIQEDNLTVQWLPTARDAIMGYPVSKDRLQRLLDQIVAISGDLARLAGDIGHAERPASRPDKSRL
jgi:hypothetical protein